MRPWLWPQSATERYWPRMTYTVSFQRIQALNLIISSKIADLMMLNPKQTCPILIRSIQVGPISIKYCDYKKYILKKIKMRLTTRTVENHFPGLASQIQDLERNLNFTFPFVPATWITLKRSRGSSSSRIWDHQLNVIRKSHVYIQPHKSINSPLVLQGS